MCIRDSYSAGRQKQRCCGENFRIQKSGDCCQSREHFTHVQSAVERILVEKIRFKTGQVVLRGVCTRHLFTQACALKSCQVAEVIRMDKIIVKSTK